jgi:hypothetical protein
VELPNAADPRAYAIGFVLATGLIHVTQHWDWAVLEHSGGGILPFHRSRHSGDRYLFPRRLMEVSVILHGFVEIASQIDLTLALIGLGLSIGVLPKEIRLIAVTVFAIADFTAVFGGHPLISKLHNEGVVLLSGLAIGGLANLLSGATLLAPAAIASPFNLLAVLGNGLIIGLLIAFKAPGGPGEVAFTVGCAVRESRRARNVTAAERRWGWPQASRHDGEKMWL